MADDEDRRMELAVVGRSEFVLGFRLAGVRKTYAVEDDDAAALEGTIERVLDDESVGILVLSASDRGRLGHGMRRRLETVARPVVIAVGGAEEEDLRTKVRRAIGIDLLG